VIPVASAKRRLGVQLLARLGPRVEGADGMAPLPMTASSPTYWPMERAASAKPQPILVLFLHRVGRAPYTQLDPGTTECGMQRFSRPAYEAPQLQPFQCERRQIGRPN